MGRLNARKVFLLYSVWGASWKGWGSRVLQLWITKMPSDSSSLVVTSQEVTQREGAPKARSSHDVAVVGGKAYVFGGEFEPRVPIDNKMYVFDLNSRAWSVAEAKGEVPKPRVGVTMVAAGSTIYVFAGRDELHEELNEFYSFETKTGEWKLLSSSDKSPPNRSYHTLAVDEDLKNIYTFGGCGKDGRLNDLWVFSIESGNWQQLPGPPPESSCIPRGGPGLVVVNGAVWVIFGFCGHELTDVHKFDIAKQVWEEVKTLGEKPIGRSVFGSACIGKNILIYGGEVDPSDQGHLGAGAFIDEVLVLDTEKLVWSKPGLVLKHGNHPGARGWFAAAGFGNSMLVYGGNSDTNDRLDDMFVLTLEVATP